MNTRHDTAYLCYWPLWHEQRNFRFDRACSVYVCIDSIGEVVYLIDLTLYGLNGGWTHIQVLLRRLPSELKVRL